MRVIDRYRGGEVVAESSAALLRPDGRATAAERVVLVEHALDVAVNTVPTLRLVCTPAHLTDLVIGRLYTEGIIAGIDEVDEVYLCEQGTRARVTLGCCHGDFSRRGVETVPSCCTGNRVYNRYFTTDAPPRPVEPIEWNPSWVFGAARVFADDSPLHRATTGTHSCYLMVGGDLLVCREDLGRHNAFDKVVGAALRQEIDLRQALVFSSGRLPVDMVMKAIRAGIPLLATKAVPTDETVRLAREFGLTLVCQARPDSAVVYHDPLGCAAV
ncbi:MAG: formate dehydrogenase accessory sulfurtransferase FdhD [Eggerthellaceae bacterium]|jgi:FdhD protein|nr:formate dehydrogenase accessory sulfurtransferase FdhD [Eggerthellaceae bacterium]